MMATSRIAVSLSRHVFVGKDLLVLGCVRQRFDHELHLHAVIEDAVRAAKLVVREGSPLRLAPIPQLIALKLYAGGHKSKADVVELLLRNPELDLAEVRAACKRYNLAGLEELIAEAS